MAKLKLAFNQICNDLLSSGNIYWQRSSGAEVLISSKGDILNLEMVNKLEKLKQQMLIEDAIDFTVQEVLLSKFEAYETETDFKQKMKLRKEFNMHLTNYFLYSSKTQFEMNQLCWKLFSEIKTDVGASFLNRDRDYFKRSTSIASSMVLIAFLIGYYDPKFLRDLYSSTITNQMMIGYDSEFIPLKKQLVELQKKVTLEEKDHSIIKEMIDTSNSAQSFSFERFNGSGPMKINVYEMSDLELVFCSLNYFYKFDQVVENNILLEIKEGRFNIDVKIKNIIKANFKETLEEEIRTA